MSRCSARIGAVPVAAAALLLIPVFTSAAEPSGSALAAEIRRLQPNVMDVEETISEAGREHLRDMIGEDARNRLREANLRDVRLWRKIKTRLQWERLRDKRIASLRESLGQFPPPPKDLKLVVTRSERRDGYVVENIVFESRPGLLVTAHLYRPAKDRTEDAGSDAMPGILISHSHHRPKEQGELQDMGALWAQRGCVVLVPDQLGHGERRQHPFRSAADYPDEFLVSRQDYYFRYNVGMQLHLIGDSLIGWMVWDLRRSVDLLLSLPGIDKDRIVLLGAVAGGGDPCAVTAAIDSRIAAAVPYNFGGPQPQSQFPLPEDAETQVSYTGSGSWESTRNLRLSARDGFFPYVIVGSIAPRRLIYAHEFRWDRQRDPVWKRFQTIWGDFYDARDNLASAYGFGYVKLRPPEASHCTNIGPIHRKMIYPSLQPWFGIQPPAEERQDRREIEQTLCLSGPRARQIRMRPVIELAEPIAQQRIAAFREQLAGATPAEQCQRLGIKWRSLLGDVRPAEPKVSQTETEPFRHGHVERFVVRQPRDILLPVVLLRPRAKPGEQLPVVVMFAQSGKQALLEARAEVIASLLESGIAVCLPDLRGTGETQPSNYRGRRSAATGISSTELMLGQTLVASRLKDLRTVLALLRSRPEFDGNRIALWGDSLAGVNGPDDKVELPLGIDEEPKQPEPLGHLLALLAGIFEPDVAVVVSARGGLTGFRATLESPFCHLPHDVVVPGALTAGDLADLAAAIAPRPLLLAGMVDGVNRTVTVADAKAEYAPTQQAYSTLNAAEQFQLRQNESPGDEFARWLAGYLAE